MKKIIQWLAKVFNADITIEKIVTKEVVKYISAGTIDGDVMVDGNLVVNGKIEATGGITCLKN
jgi:hypothetical protein